MQLADRVLVMTYRPGQVKRIVDIDLPRPRSSEIVSSEAFGRYVAQIWADLREEATRGMREDESRAAPEARREHGGDRNRHVAPRAAGSARLRLAGAFFCSRSKC